MTDTEFPIQHIWSMIEDGNLTDNVEAHYRTLLYDLDLACYHNCHIPDPGVPFYKAMGLMALALPSVAYTDPFRTREVEYNLYLTAKNIGNSNLSNPLDMYDSGNIRMVFNALACELYRLVSGRKQLDEMASALVEIIKEKIEWNYRSKQKIYAIDTVTGRFDMFPNLLAILAFEIHDAIHGTEYSSSNDRIIDGLNLYLRDDRTGLYFDSIQTGSFGFEGQELDPQFFWVVKNIRPGSNALNLNLMHYLRPQEAEAIWPQFKAQFGEQLLNLKLEDLKGNSGNSFVTPLGLAEEDLLSSLWLAKEIGDVEFFNNLQSHLFDICKPKRIEARIFYDQLEADGPLVSYFSLLAQSHVGWKQLIERDWSQHYHKDYVRVR